MSQVSKYPLNKAVKEEIIQSLWWLVEHLTHRDEVDKFLNDFLTETEKIVLAKRLGIALMLTRGYSFTDIRDTLKVSTSTIGKMANWLQKGGIGYKVAINKLTEKERMDEFWKGVAEVLKMIGKGRRVFPKR